MADDAGECHIRLVYFLANGCTKLARKIVSKLVEFSKPKEHKPVDKRWSLDDFLHENMSKLLAGNKCENTRKKLFPGFQKEANAEDWDLHLLCHVIMTCSNNQHVIQDIKQLKNIRNELYHIGNTNIEIKRYEHHEEVIEVVVERCCAFINKPDFTLEMNTFMDHFKKGQIVINDEDLQKIRHWYETDPVSELLCKVDGLAGDHKMMIDKLDEMMNFLKLNGVKGVVLPDTNVELIVKNCNTDKESVISEHLVKLLNSKIEKDMPEEHKVKIRQAVKEAMSELLSGGREVTDVYLACVNLQIKCPTFENMKDLWIDCMTGKMTRVFKTVEKYIREITGYPDLVLEVGITHFEFYRVFEDTVMAIEKTLRPDKADIKTVQKEEFNEISDASLSDAVMGSESLFQSQNEMPLEQTTREGTRVVFRVQPRTFSQAEQLWEACHSGRFNKKLEKLSQAFQQVYGFEELKITGKIEEASPYQDIFRKKTKYTEMKAIAQRKAKEEDDDIHMEYNMDIPNIQKLPFVDANTTIMSRVQLLVLAHQEFQEKLKSLEKCYNKLDKKTREKEEKGSTLKDIEKVLSHTNKLNDDMKEKEEELTTSVKQCQEEIHRLESIVISQQQELRDLLQTIRGYIDSVIPDLKKEVKRYQKEIANKYIELISSDILQILASWCSDVGYVVYEMKEKFINRWKQLVIGRNTITKDMAIGECLSAQTYMEAVFKNLIKSTFIVTNQSDYCVRVYKKQLPKITVRFLALDKIDLHSVEVRAVFLQENDKAFTGDTLDNDIQGRFRLKYADQIFSKIKAQEHFEVTFDKIDLVSEEFERLGSQHSTSSYFQDLFRFVFFTTIEGQSYWTMSLPLVVITDASQCCCALAAVMWNCFDTDIYSLPLHKNTRLPWLRVAEMLKTKFLKICTDRPLTDENLVHLKRRLLGREDVSDKTEVSLSRFCFEPLSNCTFSFWKWFLGNYNLVETYLKRYWQERLINGFASRSDVEKIFKRESKIKTGSFILRFSDNNITDSIGTSSVFGFLTAIVAIKADTKDGITLRFEAVEVANHKQLRSKGLANILKESLDKTHVYNIYKYLIPGYRKREDCFDVHCSEEKMLKGYIGRQDSFLIDLEQEMSAAVKPVIQRQHSTSSESSDSGISSTPSEDRSLSPAYDEHMHFGVYHHAESVINCQVDVMSPSTPNDSIPNFESLFSLTKSEAKTKNEASLNQIETVKKEQVDGLVERLTCLAKDSPEKFASVLNFLLSQSPQDVLSRLIERIDLS